MLFRRFTGLEHIHLVGIGGAGMSGIAEVLRDYDLKVSGSDKAKSETVRRLTELGIEVHHGHEASNVEGADLLVVSSAVPSDNPEVMAARQRGIAVVRRAEMLAELMRLKYGIAVAGTHGKTTTTSLIGTVLTEAQLDPTVIVGGRLRVSGTGARHGKSELMVAEADEFDRSFLSLAPVLAIITSIDVDHLDTYRDLDEIQDAFVTFARRVPFFGRVILCLDDPQIQEILPRLEGRRVTTYGVSPQAEWSATEIEQDPQGSRFRVRHAEEGDLGEIALPMPGIHNVQNALAAVAVGRVLELPFDTIAKALSGFGGVHRRFETLGEWRSATVVDDYAHHPTEVAAVLSAARHVCPTGRIHAVFQPHLYTRTRDLAEEFGRALMSADRVVVTGIYASREAPIEGVSGKLVVEAARSSGHRQVHFVRNWREVPDVLADVEPNDLILTLGAGNIYRLGRQLVREGTR